MHPTVNVQPNEFFWCAVFTNIRTAKNFEWDKPQRQQFFSLPIYQMTFDVSTVQTNTTNGSEWHRLSRYIGSMKWSADDILKIIFNDFATIRSHPIMTPF